MVGNEAAGLLDGDQYVMTCLDGKVQLASVCVRALTCSWVHLYREERKAFSGRCEMNVNVCQVFVETILKL